jgi:hypothetical protein
MRRSKTFVCAEKVKAVLQATVLFFAEAETRNNRWYVFR